MTADVDLLLRAADRLEQLDRAATTAQDGWMGWSAPERGAGEVYAGPMVDGYRTGTVMSWSEDDEDGHVASPEDIDLICLLRNSAGPLAAWLRSTADRSASGNGIPVGRGIWLEPAVAVARSIVGEDDGTFCPLVGPEGQACIYGAGHDVAWHLDPTGKHWGGEVDRG